MKIQSDTIADINKRLQEIKQERALFLHEEQRLKKELYYYQFLVQLEGDYDLLKDCVSRT